MSQLTELEVKDVAEWRALVREALEKRKVIWLRIRAHNLLLALDRLDAARTVKLEAQQ